MADFLTRLAGRTLGVVPTVQPMIAPMFAPDPFLLAGQASSPVFEEVSGGVPGQPSPWPAGRENINLPGRAPLQAAPAAEEQERGANLFATPAPLSPRQDTAFSLATGTEAGTAQAALPPVSDNNPVHSQHTPPPIFVTGEGGQTGMYITPSSTFTTDEGDMPGTASYIPLSSIPVIGEVIQRGAGTPLPSQFVASEGGQAGTDFSLTLPATLSPAPDKTGLFQTREIQMSPSQPAQGQLGSASTAAPSTMQDYQGSNVSHTVMQRNSLEEQQTGGSLRQPVISEKSRSQANMRWAATDTTTSRHELSPEGAAPATPTAPTIQVTIGRIEVRATQPPPSQRQAPRPGPRMVSLEEYLNQQAKGGQ